MKKIALICPSNLLYMPYVKTYEQLLQQHDIRYDIIHWDRCQLKEQAAYTYCDDKKGLSRTSIDYWRFSRYIKHILVKEKYDMVIVFSVQLAFFLRHIVGNNFKRRYVIDIRDYHPLLKLRWTRHVLQRANLVVVSSSAYKKWLPLKTQIIINHNINTNRIQTIEQRAKPFKQKPIVIANIGATRDINIQFRLMNGLKQSQQFTVVFHGKGPYDDQLQHYMKERQIVNAKLTGQYEAHEEGSLYEKSDFINVLRENDSVNNETALPNRLYNALLYGKPLLAYKGTYVAQLIEQYHIGLVLSHFEQLEEQLLHYMKTFDLVLFEQGRRALLQLAYYDNVQFEQSLLNEIAQNNM